MTRLPDSEGRFLTGPNQQAIRVPLGKEGIKFFILRRKTTKAISVEPSTGLEPGFEPRLELGLELRIRAQDSSLGLKLSLRVACGYLSLRFA